MGNVKENRYTNFHICTQKENPGYFKRVHLIPLVLLNREGLAFLVHGSSTPQTEKYAP